MSESQYTKLLDTCNSEQLFYTVDILEQVYFILV